MGGLIYKNKRMNLDEYEDLKKFVTSQVAHLIGKHANYHIIKNFKNKKDFGDLDVLISNSYINTIKEKYKDFNSDEIHKNSNCISLNVDMNTFKAQVDFIFVPDEDFKIAKLHYDYNDLGLLIGKMAHYYGLKFGWDGLKYSYYNLSKSKKLVTVYLTKNINRVLEFFNLDMSIYQYGFDSLDDMFNWLSCSKFFHKDVYEQSNWRSDQRRRDNKRKNLLEFYKWLDSYKDEKILPKPDNNSIIYWIDSKFPEINIFDTISDAIIRENKFLLVKCKFSGRIVLDKYPQINKITLGAGLKRIREAYRNIDERLNYLLNEDNERIIEKFFTIEKEI